MQIDFHHATAYVVARDAGFSDDDADIIAYASQYVAGATTTGIAYNLAAFNHINSAHEIWSCHSLRRNAFPLSCPRLAADRTPDLQRNEIATRG